MFGNQNMFGLPGPVANMFGRVPGMLGRNSNALMQAGLGILGGDNPQEGFRNAARGLAVGREQDMDAADRKRQEEDEKRLREALAGLTNDPSMAGLSGPVRNLMAADPGFAKQMIAAQMQPADMPASYDEWKLAKDNPDYAKHLDRNKGTRFGFTDVNGTLLRTDNQSGTAEQVYESPTGGQANPASVSNITTIRKEYESQPGTTRYRTAAPILSSMTNSIGDTSAMSDLDFVYGMAKVFDPESVVRESEMGMVIEGQSLPASIVGLFSKVANGEQVLQPQARKDLVKAARRRVEEYRKQAEGEAKSFTGLAERMQIDSRNIVRPLEDLPAEVDFEDEATIPEGATVEDENGHRFIKRGGALVPVQ